MPAAVKTHRKPAVLDVADGLATIPSPAKVQATAAQIRDSWTPRQRRRRAKMARYLLLQQLLASSDALPAAPPNRATRLTPKCPPSR